MSSNAEVKDEHPVLPSHLPTQAMVFVSAQVREHVKTHTNVPRHLKTKKNVLSIYCHKYYLNISSFGLLYRNIYF